MTAETWTEQLRRLNEMANEGSGAMDLSPRDCQAINAMLKRLAELEAENTKLSQQRDDEAWMHAACLTIAETGQRWGENVQPSLAMQVVYDLYRKHQALITEEAEEYEERDKLVKRATSLLQHAVRSEAEARTNAMIHNAQDIVERLLRLTRHHVIKGDLPWYEAEVQLTLTIFRRAVIEECQAKLRADAQKTRDQGCDWTAAIIDVESMGLDALKEPQQ